MNKFFTIVAIALFVISNQVVAQNVAINNDGSDPHASAILDVNSTDKGILVPRVAINDLNTADPVTTPAKGLFVFSDGGTVPDGFYYWGGSSWVSSLDANTNLSTYLFGASQYGELYENNSFASPTSVPLTSNTTWYPWVSAAEGYLEGMTSDVSDATGSKLVIAEDGNYELEISISFGATTTNAQVIGKIFVTSGVTTTPSRVQFFRKIGSTGDLGSASAHGVVMLSAGDEIDLRFQSSTDNETISLYTVNLIATKVGN